MRNLLPALALSGLLFAVSIPQATHAQIELSPLGSVSQTIDGTTIDIEYSRPALRGRTGMFGGPIWWGHIWTPGADWATILEINKDITLDGNPIPAGKYSMWMVVAEEGDWEVWLDPVWKQFHLPEPEKNGDEITFWVTPNWDAPTTENLTFDFPVHSNTGTTLRLRFENMEVTMDIAVESRLQMFVTEEEAAPFVGTFRTQVNEYVWTPQPFVYDMNLWYEGDQLQFNMQMSPSGEGGLPFDSGMLPLPQAKGIFYVSFLEGGKVFQTTNDMFEFLFDDEGNVTGFELRAEDDTLWMVGEKTSG